VISPRPSSRATAQPSSPTTPTAATTDQFLTDRLRAIMRARRGWVSIATGFEGAAFLPGWKLLERGEVGGQRVLNLPAPGHPEPHGDVVVLLPVVPLERAHPQVEHQRRRLVVIEEPVAGLEVRLPVPDADRAQAG